MWKTARDAANYGDTSFAPMEIGAGRGQADDGEQSARKARGKEFESDDNGQYRQGNKQNR